MKRLVLFSCLIFTASLLFSQEAAKDIKKAARFLGSYNLDPMGNLDKLDEAVKLVDGAIQSGEELSASDYLTVGDVYSAASTSDVNNSLLKPEYEMKYRGSAFDAKNMYVAAIERAERKNQTRDALAGLNQLIGLLSNEGVFYYESKNYEKSYYNFKAVIDIHYILVNNNNKSPLDDPEELENQKFILAVAGGAGGFTEEALQILEDIYNTGTNRVAIYDQLINIYLFQEEYDKVEKLLSEGRAKFPEEVSLLFSEINYYLKQNKVDQLESKLKEAIEKEPDNLTLYTTLGSTYDQIFQKYMGDGELEQAEEYFNKAVEQYTLASLKNDQFADAFYALGAIHFNKAAFYIGEMNKLAEDYSSAAQKKYDALNASANKEFDSALEYFKKSEHLDPNDLNTLVALREIFARKNNLEASKEFGERIKKVQGGEKLESSYY
jgi:tetratricopeptide (TPR) repeat protein